MTRAQVLALDAAYELYESKKPKLRLVSIVRAPQTASEGAQKNLEQPDEIGGRRKPTFFVVTGKPRKISEATVS